jgi:hypothetical protein
VFDLVMDRLQDLEMTRRSVVMVPPGQLAMRREAVLQLLEELIDALQRLEAVRRAVEDARS